MRLKNLLNLLYNPESELDINRMIRGAEESGYKIKRRLGLRRWLGGGYIDIPPFVNPPGDKKGVGEVSSIYSAVHELDPHSGHLAQFEQKGTGVYKDLRNAEIEASLTALKAVPRYGILTDPLGLVNQIVNLLVFASGLGKLQYELRNRDKFALLDQESTNS